MLLIKLSCESSWKQKKKFLRMRAPALHSIRCVLDWAIWVGLGWEADEWMSCSVSWENSAGGCSLTDCWPLPDTTWPPAATSWLTGGEILLHRPDNWTTMWYQATAQQKQQLLTLTIVSKGWFDCRWCTVLCSCLPSLHHVSFLLFQLFTYRITFLTSFSHLIPYRVPTKSDTSCVPVCV